MCAHLIREEVKTSHSVLAKVVLGQHSLHRLVEDLVGRLGMQLLCQHLLQPSRVATNGGKNRVNKKRYYRTD